MSIDANIRMNTNDTNGKNKLNAMLFAGVRKTTGINN